jgi:imidazolonepropionase-like amidohydrolase
MLYNGFTTARDVGGATRHYKEATEAWLIPGPRLFIGGPVLSQTGGHGSSLWGSTSKADANRGIRRSFE